MGVSLNVIIQNIAQLKARYEKTWEIITGNCDSYLFLGGKETSTLKEISESLGKETIDIEGKNQTRTVGNKSNSTSESNSILGRELMTPSELSTMPISKCILMIRSHNPFYCNKFPIEKHPNFKFTEDFDKKNAFDKYSIKVKTLEQFQAENQTEKEEIKTEQVDAAIEKLKIIRTKDDNQIEVKSEIIDFDFETYAESEMFSDSDNYLEIREQFSDEAAYGEPSDLQSFDMPEPIPGYRREVDDEVYVEFSITENSNEDNGTGEVYYDTSHDEMETIENLPEENVQWLPANQTEISAIAIDNGLIGVDSFAIF